MKAFTQLLVPCLFTAVAVLADPPAAMTVSATSSIQVGWVEHGATGAKPTPLQRTFAPVFGRALAGIYGADTEVKFVPLSANRAADRLARGELDAVVQFSSSVSRTIRDAGGHVLRAEAVSQPGHFVAFLVLPEIQPTLEGLLADAFSVSINTFEVRQSLNDTVPDLEVAGL